MTREEYIKAMAELEEKKKKIQDEYKASMPIKPQQVVIIDGKEYWLKGYRIISYQLVPVLYGINPKNGNPYFQYGRLYVDNWRKMKPKN